MVNCSIIGCRSRSDRCEDVNEDISFHLFPKDPDKRKLWIIATGRQDWKPSKNTRMCSKHFESQYLLKNRRNVHIDQSAYPTLSIQSIHPEEQVCPSRNTRRTLSELKMINCQAQSSTAHVQCQSTEYKSREMTPRSKKLFKKLKKITEIAETRKKKIAVLISKTRRLQEKNAKLTDIIQKLQSKNQ